MTRRNVRAVTTSEPRPRPRPSGRRLLLFHGGRPLPVDAVPGLGALLWPVTLVLLQLVNGVYYEVAGLWRLTAGTATRSPQG
ncbi:hypothetical protein [Kitasatospora cineracea]|uniref:hypothetical protein n=1 Tax=Kitasatospora cineracea TaxID=88074 RepID=UPI0037A40C3D